MPAWRDPVQILHDDEGLPILLINLMDRADVEMIQSRSSFGFAPKTGQCLRVFGDIIGQELKGYEATEPHILSLVHHTHSDTAQLLDDAVVRDDLADQLVLTSHWPEC
jgi:hypothetical protein